LEATIPGPTSAIPVYVASPDRTGPVPAVIVIHDALGMTTDLRHQADWLASEGYLAVAPDLFHRGGRIRCMFSAMRQAMAREGAIFDDLEATRRWVLGREGGSGKVGVIGFCLGGGFAMLLAGMGGYDASSVNYGALPKDAMGMLAAACPIVASYGGKDLSLRRAPARLEEALSAAGVSHDIAVYPDAGHGFLNDHVPAEVPFWALVSGKLVHTEYHEPSAADARARILAFFAAHLGSNESTV
jgi:carboxymethylenebutenolidase